MTIELSIKEKQLFEKAKDFSISNFACDEEKWKDCDKSFKDAVKIGSFVKADIHGHIRDPEVLVPEKPFCFFNPHFVDELFKGETILF